LAGKIKQRTQISISSFSSVFQMITHHPLASSSFSIPVADAFFVVEGRVGLNDSLKKKKKKKQKTTTQTENKTTQPKGRDEAARARVLVASIVVVFPYRCLDRDV
jgi:hypothetical protein